MNDFWISCGHHLLDRNDSGGLVVTDEFLKAYFARPELMPPDGRVHIEGAGSFTVAELLPAAFRLQGDAERST